MKLTVEHILDATIVLSVILRDQNGLQREDGRLVGRPMPQSGKYRLTRLHAKLMPEFKLAMEQRNAMIKAYDYPEIKEVDGKPVETGNFTVPSDKLEEFTAAWREISIQIVDVDVEPIPFDQLDLGNAVDGCITPAEFEALGDLIV